MKIKKTIRKIKNQDAFKVSFEVKKDDGKTHSVSFIVHGDRSAAKSAMGLRLGNFTRRAAKVEYV